METKDLTSRIEKLKSDVQNLVLEFNKETELHIDYLQVIPLLSTVGSLAPQSYQTEIVFKY